ncbi:MAG: NERD domain-containing protein [Sideroxydans sp.]|nr:NERD domain-containing protein [Sideroxydans sp.]
MIVKHADDKSVAIAELESLLSDSNAKQKMLIEKEIGMMRSGMKGESEAAYLIDFHFKDSDRMAVVHDLRFEIDGQVAQIDHLLIHRTMNVFVLETKYFSSGVKISEQGEFERWDNYSKKYVGMPSPIEQNERHIVVLEKLIAHLERYKGSKIKPRYHSLVLISPNARIIRPQDPEIGKTVIKADAIAKAVDSIMDKSSVIQSLINWTSSDDLRMLAAGLRMMHKPINVNYRAKFGIIASQVEEAEVSSSSDVLPPATFACKSCGSERLTVLYGKYGYYFKCGSCAGNTNIKLDCGVSGHKEKLRKEGLNFYRECQDCGKSALFFQNANTI